MDLAGVRMRRVKVDMSYCGYGTWQGEYVQAMVTNLRLPKVCMWNGQRPTPGPITDRRRCFWLQKKCNMLSHFLTGNLLCGVCKDPTKPMYMIRACHRYGNTCSDQVMGTTGTGTVLDFSTPWHTAYPYHSIMGIIWVNYNMVSLIFTALKLVFSDILLVFFSKFKVSCHDRTKYGCQVHIHLCFLLSPFHSPSHTASKGM